WHSSLSLAQRCVPHTLAHRPDTRAPGVFGAPQVRSASFPASATAEGCRAAISAGATASVQGAALSSRHQVNGRPFSTGTLVRVLEPPVKAGIRQGRNAHRYPPRAIVRGTMIAISALLVGL